MDKIRILVADDHPPFREGLARLLDEEPDMEVVAKTADGYEAVDMAKQLQPDVAVIDVTMPRLDGIGAVEQLKIACPNVEVLMLSAFGYEPYLLDSIHAGASGYLLKSSPVRELVSAIRSIHSGKAVFDLKAAGKMLQRLTAKPGEDTISARQLHPRELDVLRLVAKGISNKEIARQLAISESTVHTHLVRIFRDLGVSSRTEAVLLALKEGWLSFDDLP